jgi:ketosteroid isomerase-like protein
VAADDGARREHNIQVVRDSLAAVNACDVAKQSEPLADDVSYEAPYYELDVKGKERLLQMYAEVGRRFSSLDYRMTDVWPTVDPDLVICEVRGDNVVTGSDHRYQNHYIMFVTFRDGKIVRWVEYSNPKVYDRAAAAAS